MNGGLPQLLYVLQQLERCPSDLTAKGILRIEAELKKMCEQMHYLLRKKYGLKESQVNRVLKKFQKLGISPITLQNRSENNALPSILSEFD